MTTIVSSTYTVGVAQADGRIPVTETHMRSDGRTEIAEYLAVPGMDLSAVMSARARHLNERYAAEEEEAGAALQNVILTTVEFERLFTDAEFDVVIPFLEGGFEYHPALSDAQKLTIRRGMREYTRTRDGVNLRDARTIGLVQMLEALGLIEPGRAEVILGG